MSKQKKRYKFCLGVWNCDTESTKEGYMSAFMGNRWESRLIIRKPEHKGHTPSKRWLNQWSNVIKLTESEGSRVRYVKQNDVREFFRRLQEIARCVEETILEMDDNLTPDRINVYWIINFANSSWDIEVIKGIVFTGEYDYSCVGQESDLVELRYGYLRIRDFLRTTGFGSVQLAGRVCMNAKKLDGREVYELEKKDIPKLYTDYPQTIRDYMENDVAVMDEALNIIVNRRENRTIETYSDLPMTSTSFGRWRMSHNEEIIIEDGKKINVSGVLTMARWQYARPHILYLMRAYKGGYCGPNPFIQYKVLKDIICYDAVSMYPDKMLYHDMMQCTKYTKVVECPYTLEECLEHPEIEVCRSAAWRIGSIYNYIETFDENGLTTIKADDHEKGLCPWIGTVTLNIYGVREHKGAHMMPFLSKHKIENEMRKKNPPKDPAVNLLTINGKIMRGENIRTIMSSVDLMLTILCYDCEIVQLSKWITMSWRAMLPVQKRDLWEAYQRKMHLSDVLKRDRFTNDEYWRNECGFDPDVINALSDSEYKAFTKEYKRLTKTDPNGKYGMTVERPVHPKTEMSKGYNGMPVYKTESESDMVARLIADPMSATPDYVKNSDYCAGSSITMWARWQLIMMMYCFLLRGIEVEYCDTDSLFVKRSDAASECVRLFNERKKKLYWSTMVNKDVCVTVDDAEGLGQFEVDKECDYFRTLGAKNYGYIRGDKIKLTVAGLRAADYERFMHNEIESGKDIVTVFRERYRANVCVHPDACHKLLMDRSGEGYDEFGDWRGPTLVEFGFFLCDSESSFHAQNMVHCATAQGLNRDYYTGLFGKRMDVTSRGFSGEIELEDGEIVESFGTLEDQQPIKGGMV